METAESVLVAVRAYRRAVERWHRLDNRLDDLKRPADATQKAKWRAANDACRAAEEDVYATEKALLAADRRLAREERARGYKPALATARKGDKGNA